MVFPVAEHLKLSDFDYDLPESSIAQEPALNRDHSRLMVLQRSSGMIEHRVFLDIENYLRAGDLLVLNDTKVMPCRLPARKPGGGRSEIFLLNERSVNVWEALVKGGVGTGRRLTVNPGITAEILEEKEDAVKIVRFSGVNDIRTALPRIGVTPLPPYIKRNASQRDRERYQTVYAVKEGAVAAPTAGLHFTTALLDRLRSREIEFATVTLHVGPGTFQPVRAEIITDHQMHPECYFVSADAACRINRAKADKRRVIAVGTTSVRTMETAADAQGTVIPGEGSSTLFIYPGYRMKVVDGLITNFHLPKSTLLMLVSALAGREFILSAYRTAVRSGYRFYSYGDAMAIF